jgi:hypothetical protein
MARRECVAEFVEAVNPRGYWTARRVVRSMVATTAPRSSTDFTLSVTDTTGTTMRWPAASPAMTRSVTSPGTST